MTPAQVDHMLQTDYPKINQVIVNLPELTAGWDDIPGTVNLLPTRGGGVAFLAPLLLVLGIVVIAFGTTMVVVTWRGVPENPLKFAWMVVPVVVSRWLDWCSG
ncbi:hypothetical protein [Candidatus Mycobacterium methanotrophicum]|uniref:Uncharacterized protein n=2 Tax=Candidatus Mycobacterium methanotrophicum TaxID=2943498 RepID=A0ABY4QQS9_9MYCO|nr:hypothetical protein [Candidatus Mycobacterium methanotrophicum]UQX13370.1 hypothetical protein M5I08_21075 [Candidatus Mycobacterium methanotrophicum]